MFEWWVPPFVNMYPWLEVEHEENNQPLSNENLEQFGEELNRQHSEEERKENKKQTEKVIKTVNLERIFLTIDTLIDELR